MNQSNIKLASSVLSIRVKKSIILVEANRKRIFQERLNHYLFTINTRNNKRSKKWWSFILPRSLKTKVLENQVSEKIKKKMVCKWGDLPYLNKLLTLCLTGYEVTVSCQDMNILVNAEMANSWNSGVSKKKSIEDIEKIWS